MTPESTRFIFRSKSSETSFFGQNQPNPPFLAKIDQDHLFRSTTSFSSQNWLKPLFFGQNRPKPVFPAKSDWKQFFRSKPVFPVKISQNHYFRPKSTKTSFFSQISGQNRPKSTSFSGQKSTETSFFWLETSFSGQNRPKPLLLAKFDQNKFLRPKLTKTTLSRRKTEKWKRANWDRKEINNFSSVLIPSLD